MTDKPSYIIDDLRGYVELQLAGAERRCARNEKHGCDYAAKKERKAIALWTRHRDALSQLRADYAQSISTNTELIKSCAAYGEFADRIRAWTLQPGWEERKASSDPILVAQTCSIEVVLAELSESLRAIPAPRVEREKRYYVDNCQKINDFAESLGMPDAQMFGLLYVWPWLRRWAKETKERLEKLEAFAKEIDAASSVIDSGASDCERGNQEIVMALNRLEAGKLPSMLDCKGILNPPSQGGA